VSQNVSTRIKFNYGERIWNAITIIGNQQLDFAKVVKKVSAVIVLLIQVMGEHVKTNVKNKLLKYTSLLSLIKKMSTSLN
jgi:hypothetical protein